MLKPRALVPQARGSNRDLDVMDALGLAGADPVGVPLNDLRARKADWRAFQMLILPGGFSYADALGAGRLLALDLNSFFADEINTFVMSGKLVLGICNGFQALIKSGILPGNHASHRRSTLTFNASGHFECRWVTLAAVSQTCLWTRGLEERISCPVAHGEGNFQTSDATVLADLTANNQVALVYTHVNGTPAGGKYPLNPNGSLQDIAGICNPQGNVLGLMPHPENHIHPNQLPQWSRGVRGQSGLGLFINGVKASAEL
jgi:phosphoribosylformylglycinamidine synthase